MGWAMRGARIRHLLMMAGAGLAMVAGAPAIAGPVREVQRATLPAAKLILARAEQVADWQLAHRDDFRSIPTAGAETRSSRNWQQAAFYTGLAALADRSRSPRFRTAIFANGEANGWALAERPFHADDQAIAASYVWAYRHGAPAKAIAALQSRADAIIAAAPHGPLAFTDGPGQPNCQQRWCWSDALFMAPPPWFALTRVTRDPRYAAYADREFRATTDYLFDPVEHLYFRDSRFFERRTSEGRKLFWARGNGWAFGGLARVLDELPAHDPRRTYYIGMFRKMAAKLVAIQKPDGYWSPSLLADPKTMPPESSGTGFFVYGLAWGVKHGILNRAATMPAIERGWAALDKAVQPDGMLGWVQQVSDRPDVVNPRDTQYYGVGAFLLAATAVYDLKRGR